MKFHLASALTALSCIVPATLALAADPAATHPADKPPISQGWMDVATFASPGMPSMAAGMMMGGGDTPLSMLMGGKKSGNQFGRTRFGGGGSFLDVTLMTTRNPSLQEAVQAVPEGSKLAPTLQLKVLPDAKPAAHEYKEGDIEEPAQQQQPKGKIKLYWGCGTTIRPGQPKVVDLATGTIGDLAEIFKGRRATQRGAHSAPGRPVWPNLTDKRLVPDGASLVGQHAFTGQGVPDDFKFTLPPAQDIMPPIALKQVQADGVTQLTWAVLPTARAYFIAAMGGRGERDSGAEVTIWTSSELPDSGFGLIDYQTNKAVDLWLKDKVLLPPTTTRCDIPKGIFPEGSGGMLRMIAYGSELDLAYPPRPTDPTVAWEPDWALKVRVKSVAMSMLGMPGGMEGATPPSAAGAQGTSTPPADQPPADQQGQPPKKKKGFSLSDAIEAAKQAIPH